MIAWEGCVLKIVGERLGVGVMRLILSIEDGCRVMDSSLERRYGLLEEVDW